MNGNPKVPLWSSPKTTAMGIVQLVAIAGFVVFKLLIVHQEIGEIEVALIFTGFTSALAAIFARDNNKSSEDVGVTDRF